MSLWTVCSQQLGTGAVPITVTDVFSVCPVSQIDHPVVKAITVEVPNLQPLWAWTDERLSDQLMH